MNQMNRATRYERDWRETRDGRSADVRSGGGSHRVPNPWLSREKGGGEDLERCGKLLWHGRTSQVRTSRTSSVYLVRLVYLVVWFLWVTQQNKPDRPDEPDRPNRPNEPDRLADFFSSLLGGIRFCREAQQQYPVSSTTSVWPAR